MKKIIIISIGFLFVFSACRKNEDVTEVRVEVPDPSELGPVGVDGRLTNEFGDPVAGVRVDLYHDGEEAATQITDENGYYQFSGLEYSETPFYLWTKVDGLHRTYKSYYMSGTPTDRVDCSLETTLHTPIVEGALTEFTFARGQITTSAGQPVRGKFVVFNQNQAIYSYGESTNEGDYEAMTPYNEAYSIVLLDWCGNIIRQESFNAQIEDTFIGTTNSAERGIPVTISGNIKNVAGEAVSEGYLLLHYGDTPRTQQLNLDTEGNFSFRTFECLLGQNIVYQPFNINDNQISSSVSINYTGGDLELGTIQTDLLNQYSISYSLDGQNFNYKDHYVTTGTDSNGANSILVKGARSNQISFEIQDLVSSLSNLMRLRIVHEDPNLSAESNENTNNVFFTILNYDNTIGGELKANFSGTFHDILTGQEKSISGTLTLPVY